MIQHVHVTEYIELLNHGLFQRPDNHGTGRPGIPPELRVTTLLLRERSCRGSQVPGSQIHQRISCRFIEYIIEYFGIIILSKISTIRDNWPPQI